MAKTGLNKNSKGDSFPAIEVTAVRNNEQYPGKLTSQLLSFKIFKWKK
jgi:hypothetical protein